MVVTLESGSLYGRQGSFIKIKLDFFVSVVPTQRRKTTKSILGTMKEHSTKNKDYLVCD